MKRILYLVIVVLSFLLIGCRKDPKKFIITDKNKESYLEDMKDMKGLTVGEVRLLVGYELVRGGKKLNGENADLIVGKSIEQVLELAKQELEFIKKKQKEKEEQHAKQKEKEEEKEAQQKEITAKKVQLFELMKKALVVTLQEKKVVPQNLVHGIYNDHVILLFSAQNQLDKGIRAIRGTLVFGDLFDKEMCKVSISYDEAIESKKTVNLKRVLEVHSYDKGLVWLKEAAPKDIKWVWVPESMLLSDGTIASVQ